MMSRVSDNKDDLIILYKVQIPRNIFSYNLNIAEIRLCVLLTSIKSLCCDNLTYDEKLYVVGGKKSNLKRIDTYSKKLKSLGLITQDGKGLSLKEYGIESYSISPVEFYSAESIREVFALCCKVWRGKNTNFALINDAELENLFTKRNFNRYLKRLNNTLKKYNFKLEYTKTRNNYHQFKAVDLADEVESNLKERELNLDCIGNVKKEELPNIDFYDLT